MLVYNYTYMLKIQPRFIHAWRQYDCLSFAQSFKNDRATIWQPKVNNLGANSTGKAASEFPIVPFIIGKIWSITGTNVAIYRALNILLLTTALFFIYLLFLGESGHKPIAVGLTALIFTSPNLSYYGVSVISDIQAFSLSIIGFYMCYTWVRTRKRKYFIFFSIAFLLAGLIKASFILIYLVSMLYLIMSVRKEILVEWKTREWLTKLGVMLVLLPFLWLAWIAHAHKYNLQNTQAFFLVGVLPIWDLDPLKLEFNTNSLVNNLVPQVYNIWAVGILILISIVSGVKSIKRSSVFSGVILTSVLLIGAYIILFYGAFDVHDYYLIVVIALLVVCSFLLFKEYKEMLLRKRWKLKFLSSIVFLFAFNTYLSGIKTWKKTNMNVAGFESKIVLNDFEQKDYFWIYWHDRRLYEPLEEMKEEIKERILKEDTIICMGDQTINRSLFLLDRVGYTEFNCKLDQLKGFLPAYPHVKYLVLLDPEYKKRPELEGYQNRVVFEKDSITVYRTRD